jgi:hypothetical protein
LARRDNDQAVATAETPITSRRLEMEVTSSRESIAAGILPLASLAVLVLAAVLGSSSSCGHGFYELPMRQLVATVLAFSALALAAHAASRAVAWDWARLLTIVPLIAMFLVIWASGWARVGERPGLAAPPQRRHPGRDVRVGLARGAGGGKRVGRADGPALGATPGTVLLAG